MVQAMRRFYTLTACCPHQGSSAYGNPPAPELISTLPEQASRCKMLLRFETAVIATPGIRTQRSQEVRLSLKRETITIQKPDRERKRPAKIFIPDLTPQRGLNLCFQHLHLKREDSLAREGGRPL